MGRCIVAGGKPDMAVPVSGILASELAVGSVVKLMENGVATEYLVVNQGIPSGSSLYDVSCNGTWLLRKDIIENREWDAAKDSTYATSDIHTWLNASMLDKYDTGVKNIIQQVKIPYVKTYGSLISDSEIASGSDGLSSKIFLLSIHEVGIMELSSGGSLPADGAKLSYFEFGIGTSAKNRRIAYYNNSISFWPLRSAYEYEYSVCITEQGIEGPILTSSTESGIRPALVLPFNAVFNKNTMVLKGVS